MSIHDVARIAGVSASTVSRVINNHPRVARQTAEAVRAAMEQLSYTPSLRRPGPKPFQGRGGAGSVAFLVFGTSRSTATPGFSELLRGVSLGVSRHGLNLSFSHVTNPNELPAGVTSGRIDGLLLHGALPAEPVRERLRRLPTVWLMGNRDRPAWGDQVMPDVYDVGDLAARHLLNRGHRRLVFLNLDAGHWPFRMYASAFVDVGRMCGAEVSVLDQQRDPVPTYWHPHPPEAVDRLVDRYLGLDPRPTGLFVADDMQVAMIQPVLQRRGVRVGPGEVELIACNDEAPYLMSLDPRPAVIDIRFASIGQRGVDQLVWRLGHGQLQERIVLSIEPEVVDPERNLRSARERFEAAEPVS